MGAAESTREERRVTVVGMRFKPIHCMVKIEKNYRHVATFLRDMGFVEDCQVSSYMDGRNYIHISLTGRFHDCSSRTCQNSPLFTFDELRAELVRRAICS